MGVLTGVLAPMFGKYVDKSPKSRDVYTADQIDRAVNIAFVEKRIQRVMIMHEYDVKCPDLRGTFLDRGSVFL